MPLKTEMSSVAATGAEAHGKRLEAISEMIPVSATPAIRVKVKVRVVMCLGAGGGRVAAPGKCVGWARRPRAVAWAWRVGGEGGRVTVMQEEVRAEVTDVEHDD